MLKEQRFGVEVEMTGISRKKAADVLAEVFGAIAGEPDGTCYHTRIIKDQKDRKWKVMRDSSITPVRNDNSNAPMDEYRVEMVTPPLNYEDIELLQVVIRKLRENGAKSHRSCGIHIHVDGANHTAASLRRLVSFMTARQDLIYEALEIGDRENSWCHKLNKTLLNLTAVLFCSQHLAEKQPVLLLFVCPYALAIAPFSRIKIASTNRADIVICHDCLLSVLLCSYILDCLLNILFRNLQLIRK